MPRKADIRYLADTSVTALKESLHVLQNEGKKTVLLISCTSNGYETGTLTPLLQSLAIRILGATFPSVLLGAKLYETGTILISYTEEIPVSVYHNISSTENRAGLLDALPPFSGAANLVVLSDALCGGMEPFIENLYQHFGSGLRVIGGGAGSLDFVQKPCIFSNQGFLEDAAVVARLPDELDTVTGHGWEVLDGPYVVTESDGHKVISINYQPAFDLYQEVIQNLSGKTLTQDRFFEVAMHFPFGIAELNGELLVRDPIVCENGTITCVGNVPQNATIYILQGEADNLINAAVDTSNKVLDNSVCYDKTILLFDCVSRQLYLDNRIEEELSGIDGHLPDNNQLVGAFTLGEIANREGGPIQLMNKSFVLGTY